MPRPRRLHAPTRQRLHFVHAQGDGSRPPLLLIHGWPGSFLEFAHLIAPLVADGHDVVVPPLPGFAFSGHPAAPIGPRQIAVVLHQLMTQLFGATPYFVQGGDWGSEIGARPAHAFPDACLGLHLNVVDLAAEDAVTETEAECDWVGRRAELREQEYGYSLQQSTRPQTLSVGLADSPVRVAAWILEKFSVWADLSKTTTGSPDLWQVFAEELLLTNIMLQVATGSFATSTWIYHGDHLVRPYGFPAGERVIVPTGVAAFPDPAFPAPPRSYVEQTYHVVHWTDMPSGGHFAALEQPQLFLADVGASTAHVLNEECRDEGTGRG